MIAGVGVAAKRNGVKDVVIMVTPSEGLLALWRQKIAVATSFHNRNGGQWRRVKGTISSGRRESDCIAVVSPRADGGSIINRASGPCAGKGLVSVK